MRRIHFDVTDSTNVQARRLAALHPCEPLLVTAAMQTAGRGRQGRTWQSPRGGAWLSVVWPLRRPAAESPAASLVAAVAVRRALCHTAPAASERLRIKWPNDLLLDQRKVAGILCECVPGTTRRPSGMLIVGVGVNVDFDDALLTGPLRHPPTTIADALGQAPRVEQVIDAIATQLAAELAAFEAHGLTEAVLDEMRRRLAYVGIERTWQAPTGSVTGRVLGIDPTGRLLLETAAGIVACDSGELTADAPTDDAAR